MPTPFQLELVTPERVLYSGSCEEVSLRTDEGEISFLAHHEDFVGALDITVLIVQGLGPEPAPSSAEPAGTSLRAALHGGFVHVDDRAVTILAGVAELAGEIDVERARRALAGAEERLSAEGPTEVSRAEGDGEEQRYHPTGAALALLAPESPEAAIARARVRLEAAGASSSS